MIITREELDSLKALADAATEGPWTLVELEPDGKNRRDTEWMVGFRREPSGRWWDEDSSLMHDPQTPAFIAASREAVPRLIADLERARALLWFLEGCGDRHPACAPNGACGEDEPGGPPCRSPWYNEEVMAELLEHWRKVEA